MPQDDANGFLGAFGYEEDAQGIMRATQDELAQVVRLSVDIVVSKGHVTNPSVRKLEVDKRSEAAVHIIVETGEIPSLDEVERRER